MYISNNMQIYILYNTFFYIEHVCSHVNVDHDI